MADVAITTPQSGGLNWSDYQQKIQQAAASTRATGGVTDTRKVNKQGKPIGKTALEKATQGLTGTYKGIGTAAVENYQQQAAAQKQQAEKAASALEMTGASTIQGLQNVEDLQSQIRSKVQSAADSWGAAAEKADEYVKAARSRVGEVLTKLDTLNKEFAQERNFAKAHAMQASVQSVLGSMKDEERNIVENYGTDSPEYNQFRASKLNTLATIQSNIHTSYQQLSEQQNQTYMNTVSDAYTKSNMYLGFQEQQHVDMLKFRAQERASYELQASQLDVSLEQMKMTGVENLANWIVETPSFTMDMTPLMTMLADLKTTQDAKKEQDRLARQEAEKKNTPIRLATKKTPSPWDKNFMGGGWSL